MQMPTSYNVQDGYENGWKFEHALKGREIFWFSEKSLKSLSLSH